MRGFGFVYVFFEFAFFPCHSERKRRISRKRKGKANMRLTAGCFDKLNMTV